MRPKLEVTNLVKGFPARGGRVEALAGVSLHAGEREFVTLLGPSGCGKSTLCNIVAGLYPPDGGSVALDGTILADAGGGAPSSGRRSVRGRTAYMQQKDLLLPWRTVVDNAILGLEVQGSPRSAARREAAELLRVFGLRGFERAYPGALSGGMRQRVALVRTLLCRREMLVLDEPFGALDAMTRAAMQGYLLRLRAEYGRTVLFVTHDVEEAVLLSDRIYVLSARPGRVRAEITIPLGETRRAADEGVVRLKAGIVALLQGEMAAMVAPPGAGGVPAGVGGP